MMYAGELKELKPLPMQKFDTQNVARVAERHMASLTEPRRRQILQNFIDHARAEGEGDYEALMATCSRKRQSYAQFGGNQALAASQPQSYEELEHHYRALIDSNVFVLHLDVEKLCVGDDTLYVDGILHQLYPAAYLEPVFGFQPEHPQGVYQLTTRVCTCFVFDEDGMGAGEQSYTSGVSRESFSYVPTSQVPEIFWRRTTRPRQPEEA